jgi:hypothetical protein
MTSCSTVYCYKRSDCINSKGWLAIVACERCAKHKLLCKLLLLSERCGNCVCAGSAPCVLAKILPLNFLRINAKIEKLRRQEEETDLALKAQEVIAKAALAEMRVLRAKSWRLRKQKAMLK